MRRPGEREVALTGPGAGDEDEEKSEDSGGPSLPPGLRPCGYLLSRIFSQLDCIDFLLCSLVCKQWYRDSAELREGWKNEYMEAYYQLGLGIERKTHPPSSTCSIRGVVGARNSLVLLHLLSPKTDIRSRIC